VCFCRCFAKPHHASGRSAGARGVADGPPAGGALSIGVPGCPGIFWAEGLGRWRARRPSFAGADMGSRVGRCKFSADAGSCSRCHAGAESSAAFGLHRRARSWAGPDFRSARKGKSSPNRVGDVGLRSSGGRRDRRERKWFPYFSPPWRSELLWCADGGMSADRAVGEVCFVGSDLAVLAKARSRRVASIFVFFRVAVVPRDARRN